MNLEVSDHIQFYRHRHDAQHLFLQTSERIFSPCILLLLTITLLCSFVPTGQQRNPLQGENDNTSEEAERVLQPETGMVKVG